MTTPAKTYTTQDIERCLLELAICANNSGEASRQRQHKRLDSGSMPGTL